MSKVRDRFDTGQEKTAAAEERAKWVREGIQQNTALHSIEIANAAVRAGTAGPFAVELVAAWQAQRRLEGW